MTFRAHSADVFVLGGGPAGFATPILATQEGLRVAVADHNCPPIDKTCGEGLMPDTLTPMKMLGIAIGVDEGVPFRCIRFHDPYGEACVETPFPPGFALRLRPT